MKDCGDMLAVLYCSVDVMDGGMGARERDIQRGEAGRERKSGRSCIPRA